MITGGNKDNFIPEQRNAVFIESLNAFPISKNLAKWSFIPFD